jgi:hypothetical protein
MIQFEMSSFTILGEIPSIIACTKPWYLRHQPVIESYFRICTYAVFSDD